MNTAKNTYFPRDRTRVKPAGTVIVCATAAFVRARMRPKIHWIDLPAGVRLAIMPRPRAGDWLTDVIAGWRAEEIRRHREPSRSREVEELGLHREAGLCHALDMEFISFSVPDGGVPASTREAMALAEAIVARLNEGKPLPCIAWPGSGDHRSSRPASSCSWASLRERHLIASARRGASRSRTPKGNETGPICFEKPRKPAASIRENASDGSQGSAATTTPSTKTPTGGAVSRANLTRETA